MPNISVDATCQCTVRKIPFPEILGLFSYFSSWHTKRKLMVALCVACYRLDEKFLRTVMKICVTAP